MHYIFIDDRTIKLLNLKKTLLGQEETSYYEKKYETNLLDKGKPANLDLLASALKEVITNSAKNDSQVTLVLPQESFLFFRAEVPSDIAPTALNSFITDKARSVLPVMPEEIVSDSFVKENNGQKVVTFYGLNKEVFESYQQTLSLIDLKVSSILPETLAYYKLFEKTLRNEKKENILYVNLQEKYLSGYLFDNFGLLDENRFYSEIDEKNTVEMTLKEKSDQLNQEKKKLNRIIISGTQSDKVRQDTFTKAVGVWTNPLKRIVPTFYETYLKMLVVDSTKAFPILAFDVCFGAFIFNQEEKFSLIKSGFGAKYRKSFSPPKINLPFKELLLFIASFFLSFFVFIAVFGIKSIKLPFSSVQVSPTVSPTEHPSPTPTPSFKKSELKIQLLNGSGIAGKASELKDILTKKGFQEIITGNADNYDYKLTEIKTKKSKQQAATIIKDDLKDYLSAFKETTLDDKETPDVVIIFGSDFK